MGEFALEGQIGIQDLIQTRLTPSRSVGPPDPDAPEFTWLRGAAAPAQPDTVRMAPPQAPVRTTPAAQLPSAAAPNAEPPTPQAMLAALAQLGVGIVLIDDGAAVFGGELLALSEAERVTILEVVLDAYDRVLRERAAALRGQYLSALKGEGSPLHEASSSGPPLVPALHQPQEEADARPT